jgi:methylmalonyl-CoA mutase C-terminal domain/subunit
LQRSANFSLDKLFAFVYGAIQKWANRDHRGGLEIHVSIPKGDILMARRIRVLIAKPGLDGHDRGAKVIARALRDAGIEVIYTGIRQTPEQIVHAAIQEGVDMIGLSCLSGAHNYLFPRVVEILKEKGADDIQVFGGGIIPAEDIPGLKQSGIEKIFLPGASTEDILQYITEKANTS